MPQDPQHELQDLLSSRASAAGASNANLSLGLEFLVLDIVSRDEQYAAVLDGAGLPRAEALRQFHTGGSGDGGIDALIYNEDRSRVTFIQTKHLAGSFGPETLALARDWFNRLDRWALPEVNDRLNEGASRLLKEADLDPTVQQIHMLFVADQDVPAGPAAAEYAEFAEAESDKYAERGLNVICTIWTARELLDEWKRVSELERTDNERPLQLPLTPERFFVFEEGASNVLVASVPGDAIAELYNRKDVGPKLFEENVRAALATGKINEAIRRTATSSTDGANFFYFNNGVTATCAAMTISGNMAEFTGLQVVNGAQTVSSIAKALRVTKNPNVHVLLRVIAVGDGQESSLTSSITRFQNTQNPIKVSDFFANEGIQFWLERALNERSGRDGFPAMYYEHKRGKRPLGSVAGRRKLTMENLAYLRYACLYDPPFTYKHAKEIWSGENKNERFWKAFGIDGKPVTEWPAEEVARAGWMVRTWWELKATQAQLSSRMSEELEADPENRDRIAKKYRESLFLGVLARYVVALAHEGLLAHMEAGNLHSFEEFMKAPQTHQNMNNDVIKLARFLIRREYENWVGTVANPRLNLPQSDDAWQRLQLGMRQEIASDV